MRTHDPRAEMSKLAEKVQEELIQAIDNDELVLPTLPEVALKVREAVEDPNISIPALSKVIGNDAALAARAAQGIELLAVLQEDAKNDGRLSLGSSEGPSLNLLDLPYELNADREIQR